MILGEDWGISGSIETLLRLPGKQQSIFKSSKIIMYNYVQASAERSRGGMAPSGVGYEQLYVHKQTRRLPG